jgi:hypothetical protein
MSDNIKIDRETFTNNLINQKFFSMDDAVNSFVNTKTVFIIANERRKKSGSTGRYYTVFPTFKDFLNNRDNYRHCHEILLDHKNNKPNLAGRLVFDFDLEDVLVPDDFTKQVETTIKTTIKKYFKNVDVNKFEYVWSTSPNVHKVSKHLTVKNLYFDKWINLSKIFYKLFGLEWEKKYDWIKPSNLIDFQIVRTKASLRMVGSSKIGGNTLEFDDPKFKLTDSLIRIYFKNQRDEEQLVTVDNLAINLYDFEILSDCIADPPSNNHISIGGLHSEHLEQTDPVYPLKVYTAAFELYSTLQPDVFKMGKISGNRLGLVRLKAHNCLLSNRVHEHENAFLVIYDNKTIYDVKFGCYRFCHAKKTVSIGNLSTTNLIKMIRPDFDYLVTKSKKKKSDPKLL